MTGAWKRWSGRLALSTERDFERLVLPFLRVFWPTIEQVPVRKEWDQRGIDLLVWFEGDRFPCAVQCKGFAVQDVGHDQFLQVQSSIDKFLQSGVRVETYLVIHNRTGANGSFRMEIEEMLKQVVVSGHALCAELWDRQQFLSRCRSEVENRIASALQERARNLLAYYGKAFSFGTTYLGSVPVSESRLVFRRYEPCVMVPSQQSAPRPASELVLSATDARWTLLTGSFGSGKTTTVLHAATAATKAPVIVECRSLPSVQLSSTSVLLEESLKSLCIFDSFDESDREALYEVAGTTFKGMLMKPRSNFVLIIDGLDEHRFYSQQRGMEFLSNQLADLKCPIVLTTRREHLNAMFGDFSSAFQEFSVKFSPRRDARLFVLDPWSLEQSLALCDLVTDQAEGSARKYLAEFRALMFTNSLSDLYGDLPSNPLMLRFILDDVAEKGIHQSTRPMLLDSWMRRKMRRDRQAVERVSVGESLDLEDFIGRMMHIMEAVAARMIVQNDGQVDLLERVPEDSVREVARLFLGNSTDNLLGVVLNSFLIPAEPNIGEQRALVFGFRIVQEYLLARYLKRTATAPTYFPTSVRTLREEMGDTVPTLESTSHM